MLGPGAVLKLIDDINLPAADKQKLFYDNARRILGLRIRLARSASRHWCKCHARPCTGHLA